MKQIPKKITLPGFIIHFIKSYLPNLDIMHRIKYAPSRITSVKYLKTGDLNLKYVNQKKRAMSIKQILKLVVK